MKSEEEQEAPTFTCSRCGETGYGDERRRAQCSSRNFAMRPYTCCLRREGHDEEHRDYLENTWRDTEEQPHFKRVAKTIRFFVEVDVTGMSEDEVRVLRDECEGVVLGVLERHDIDPMVERRKVRERVGGLGEQG